MYEAAIKRASTGVYFAVPYMAKLIIEFMEKNYQKENRNLRKSRDLLVERILHRYPARRVDSDDDLFDALEEYDSYRNERYERLADDQSKLCKLFMSNPKMGAFISDVIGGEDALIACVRYFGKDMLDCAEDEGRMAEVRKANDEYLSRMARFGELENQMRENLKNSTRCMERFKSEKGMSDEEFEGFLDRGKPRCVDVTSVSFSKNGNVTAIRYLLYETAAVSSPMPIFRLYSETVAAVACGTCRFLKRGLK